MEELIGTQPDAQGWTFASVVLSIRPPLPGLRNVRAGAEMRMLRGQKDGPRSGEGLLVSEPLLVPWF